MEVWGLLSIIWRIEGISIYIKQKKMEFSGIVIAVIDKSGVSKNTGNAFKAAQVVVQEDRQNYPQVGVFDLFGEKVNYPNVGDTVSVEFNLKGQEHEGKWYGKVNGWKVQVLQAASTAPTAHETATAGVSAPDPLAGDGESKDALPF